jgi:hypothetical protein
MGEWMNGYQLLIWHPNHPHPLPFTFCSLMLCCTGGHICPKFTKIKAAYNTFFPKEVSLVTGGSLERENWPTLV